MLGFATARLFDLMHHFLIFNFNPSTNAISLSNFVAFIARIAVAALLWMTSGTSIAQCIGSGEPSCSVFRASCHSTFPDITTAFDAYKAESYNGTGAYSPPADRQVCVGYTLIAHEMTIAQGGYPDVLRFWEIGDRSLSEFPSNRYFMVNNATYAVCNFGAQIGTRREVYTFGDGFTCAANNARLSLIGAKDVLPAGTGNSVLSLSAKLESDGRPKSGSAIRLSLEVVANSGGHDHHDANRPKGRLSSSSGTTDANGEFKFTFQAPEVSGIHTIKATCTGCSNEATHEIKVKVPDLVPINPNPRRQANGSFAYALTSVDNIHQGSARYHVGQYWLTKDARDSLEELIDAFNDFGWGTVALNDASLIWGGVYDINGNWRNPHRGHRTGEEIDISFTRAGNIVSRERQDSTYDEFCKKNNAAMPFNILHHFVALPHYHVYLRKQKPCAKTEN